MAYNIPTSGQWITFPINITNIAKIEWSQGQIQHAAIYYDTTVAPLPKSTTTAKLWTPRSQRQPPDVGKAGTEKAIEILGSTDLYIAAEYYDDLYKDGALQNYHLQEKCPQGCKWIAVRLNSCFHYGQNGEAENLRRFIVYHPVDPPAIFQHRFTESKVEAIIGKASAALGELPPFIPSNAGAILKQIGDLVVKLEKLYKAVKGHYLHSFLDKDGLEEARNIFKTYVKERPALMKKAQDSLDESRHFFEKHGNPGRTTNWTTFVKAITGHIDLTEIEKGELFRLVIQMVEGNRAARDNEASDAAEKARWLNQRDTLKGMTVDSKPLIDSGSAPVGDSVATIFAAVEKMSKMSDAATHKQLQEVSAVLTSVRLQHDRLVDADGDKVVGVTSALMTELTGIRFREDADTVRIKEILGEMKIRRTKSDETLNLPKGGDAKITKVQRNLFGQDEPSSSLARNSAANRNAQPPKING